MPGAPPGLKPWFRGIGEARVAVGDEYQRRREKRRRNAEGGRDRRPVRTAELRPQPNGRARAACERRGETYRDLHPPIRLPHHSPLSCRCRSTGAFLAPLAAFETLPCTGGHTFLAFTVAHADTKPHLFQITGAQGRLDCIRLRGDLWTVPRNGGRAVRLTNRRRPRKHADFFAGRSTSPHRGIRRKHRCVHDPRRRRRAPPPYVHPAPDAASRGPPDGKRILFVPRVRQRADMHRFFFFSFPPKAAEAVKLPLPMAYEGRCRRMVPILRITLPPRSLRFYDLSSRGETTEGAAPAPSG